AGETDREVREAAWQGVPRPLIKETVDLVFHTVVMLVHMNQDPAEVLEELESRFGTSGIEEKASRAK
ncbi:MAG: phosphoribosyl-ATP pyrophosphatase, partial [Pseudomonadales bacterium]|nr:phosphoribosyl-ATP pyrophosphatase [Pseudomonadales bacterium]